jgi:hypothetical protein
VTHAHAAQIKVFSTLRMMAQHQAQRGRAPSAMLDIPAPLI